MITYADRTFCASRACINECGRKITKEQRADAVRKNMAISWGFFCGEDSIVEAKEKVFGKYSDALKGLTDK